MPAKGFQIIGIEAKRHKKSGPQKQVRIDHNTNIISCLLYTSDAADE